MQKVAFEVKKIIHRNDENGFTVLRGKFDVNRFPELPATQQTIVGYFVSVFELDEFEGEGMFASHPKFGKQFQLTWAKRLIPTSKKGLQAFLVRCVKGVGKKTAEAITETLGTDAVARIQQDWRVLLDVPKISEKKAKQIAAAIQESQAFEEVFTFLAHHGIGYQKAISVYENMKTSAISNIQSNPYCLAVIKSITFEEMDRVAKKMDFPYNHPHRIQQGILAYLEKKAKQEGHLFMFAHQIKEQLPSFLLEIGAYHELLHDPIDEHLHQLEREGKVVIDQNRNGEQCVYLAHYAHIESKIVQHIQKRMNAQPLCSESDIAACLQVYESQHGIQLATKQKEAVYMALRQPISILTGGPGTGKTQTINAILFCLETIRPDAVIHLCAPTGKASKRLAEVTHREAKTIHRTIGLNGFDDVHRVQPINGDLLVVDEVSMVDAYVFYKLLSATPSNMNVLLVGDYEQLPSVGAGLVLRDLIESRVIPVTTLTEIFRQAQDSQIVTNAHKLIKGKTTKDPDGLFFDHHKGDFYFIQHQHEQTVKQLIVKSIEKMMTRYGYTLDDIQVLTPTKVGALGTHALNALIQETFNPKREGQEQIMLKNKQFRTGDKVIQTVNNYELEVFNGEVGRIVGVDQNQKGNLFVQVSFDNRQVRYPFEMAEELELAYALSVHKSQGSEFPVIIMPLHQSHLFMLNRNLIYTAWTRAKEKVICIGSQELLDLAIQRTDKTVRHSLIQEKLTEAQKAALPL
ncbi:SF1B family DNA helicase RecD2 [Geobacillus subterraneus]|uniref:ATP-dependent RecD2 DNA helicase n=1 Tax=Geobacillus subterraneus TaxID=129338 RepID=A0A679G4F4_9BACL|nr:ATP-dependent RecD-like DNA helicase [Geobacillus subterraneus]BBW98931.1 ATP-dependent RecD-like DNA helicase [Geobacillus subterraneus]